MGAARRRGTAGEQTSSPALARTPSAIPALAPALFPGRMCLVWEAPPLAVHGRAVAFGAASDESWYLSNLFCDGIARVAPQETLSISGLLLLSLPALLASSGLPCIVPPWPFSLVPKVLPSPKHTSHCALWSLCEMSHHRFVTPDVSLNLRCVLESQRLRCNDKGLWEDRRDACQTDTTTSGISVTNCPPHSRMYPICCRTSARIFHGRTTR